MTLLLHRGAEEIDLPALQAMETPEATKSHVPLPHVDLVSMVKYSLGYFGHEVIEEHHAVTEDGARYFGLLTLHSDYGDYTDTVGLRNSHDKTFPIGIAIGGQVFCCDNLSFHGEHVIRRRHTVKAKRDLPGLVAEVVEPLREVREAQRETFALYQKTALTDAAADHAIMEMYRQGIVNVTRIPEVANQWENPTYEEWGGRTAWRMFNAATYALEGRVAEQPALTRQLHDVIDGVCTEVA